MSPDDDLTMSKFATQADYWKARAERAEREAANKQKVIDHLNTLQPEETRGPFIQGPMPDDIDWSKMRPGPIRVVYPRDAIIEECAKHLEAMVDELRAPISFAHAAGSIRALKTSAEPSSLPQCDTEEKMTETVGFIQSGQVPAPTTVISVRLARAAPELLAALEAIVAADDACALERAHIDRARKAIALAK